MRELAKTFARFCAAGATNTVIGFAVIFALMALSVGPKVANISGYTVGVVLTFVFGKRWIFVSKGDVRAEIIRFMFAIGVAYSMNYIVLLYLLHNERLEAHLAQIVAGMVYTIVNFLLGNFFVFRDGARRVESGGDNEN